MMPGHARQAEDIGPEALRLLPHYNVVMDEYRTVFRENREMFDEALSGQKRAVESGLGNNNNKAAVLAMEDIIRAETENPERHEGLEPEPVGPLENEAGRGEHEDELLVAVPTFEEQMRMTPRQRVVLHADNIPTEAEINEDTLATFYDNLQGVVARLDRMSGQLLRDIGKIRTELRATDEPSADARAEAGRRHVPVAPAGVPVPPEVRVATYDYLIERLNNLKDPVAARKRGINTYAQRPEHRDIDDVRRIIELEDIIPLEQKIEEITPKSENEYEMEPYEANMKILRPRIEELIANLTQKRNNVTLGRKPMDDASDEFARTRATQRHTDYAKAEANDRGHNENYHQEYQREAMEVVQRVRDLGVPEVLVNELTDRLTTYTGPDAVERRMYDPAYRRFRQEAHIDVNDFRDLLLLTPADMVNRRLDEAAATHRNPTEAIEQILHPVITGPLAPEERGFYHTWENPTPYMPETPEEYAEATKRRKMVYSARLIRRHSTQHYRELWQCSMKDLEVLQRNPPGDANSIARLEYFEELYTAGKNLVKKQEDMANRMLHAGEEARVAWQLLGELYEVLHRTPRMHPRVDRIQERINNLIPEVLHLGRNAYSVNRDRVPNPARRGTTIERITETPEPITQADIDCLRDYIMNDDVL
jgi:hypothetical protein